MVPRSAAENPFGHRGSHCAHPGRRHLPGLLVAFGVALVAPGPLPTRAAGGADIRPPVGWLAAWDVFLGGFRQLDVAAADGPGTGWGADVALVEQVGTSTFVRFDGGHFRGTQVETHLEVRDIALRGDGTGFAVGRAGPGARGAVLALADGVWRRTATAPAQLQSVALAPGGGRAWAVGDLGTALTWTPETGWVAEEFPDGQAFLRAVAAPSADEAWAATESGELYNTVGGPWVRDTGAPAAQSPEAMAFAPGGDGMVVGGNVLLRHAGEWTEVTAAGGHHSAVAWSGSTAVVAADGKVFARRGAAWARVPLSDVPVASARVTVGDVAAAGDELYAFSRQGYAYRGTVTSLDYVWPRLGEMAAVDVLEGHVAWAGGRSAGWGLVGSEPPDGAWDQGLELPINADVTGVDLLSPEEGWAVGAVFLGSTGHSRMWHYTAGGWQPSAVGDDWQLARVQALAPDDAWTAGASLVARWDGDAWKPVEAAPFGAFSGALAMITGGAEPDGWFGGWGAVHHLLGSEWRTVDLPTPEEVRAMAVDGEGTVRALTASRLYRIEGEAVAEVQVPRAVPESRLIDMSLTDSGRLWILAAPDGLLLRSDGHWEGHELGVLGGRVRPTRVRAWDRPAPEGAEGLRPDQEVWLVGQESSVARYSLEVPVSHVYLPVARDGVGGRQAGTSLP